MVGSTDFYRVLRKAIDGLPDQSNQAARYELYERARLMIVRQQPPLSSAETDREIEALHAAVTRIEGEVGEATASTPSSWAPPAARERAAPPEAMPQADLDRPRGRPLGLIAVSVAAAVIIAGAVAYTVVLRPAGKPQVTSAESAPADAARPRTARPVAAVEKKEAPVDPDRASYVLRQQRVYYRTTHPAGTIVVSSNQRFLYVVQPNNSAIRYAIGVGRECENLAGLFRVTEKVEKLADGAAATFELPALYFDAKHAVHRTSEPGSIGKSTTLGCFQAWDADIADLYKRISLDDRVVVGN